MRNSYLPFPSAQGAPQREASGEGAASIVKNPELRESLKGGIIANMLGTCMIFSEN